MLVHLFVDETRGALMWNKTKCRATEQVTGKSKKNL